MNDSRRPTPRRNTRLAVHLYTAIVILAAIAAGLIGIVAVLAVSW